MANKKGSPKKKTGPKTAPKRIAEEAAAAAANAPKKKTRDERFAEARKQRRRKKLLTNGAITVAVLVPAALLLNWAIGSWLDQNKLVDQLTAASCKYDTKSDPGQTGEHSNNPPPYNVNPPSGGVHLPTAANAGDYSGAGASVPPDGNLVHALEHGYIAIWYKPDVSAGDLQALKDFQGKHAKDVLLVQRPSMSVSVAATAWQKRLLCGQLELDKLESFTNAYVNKGPEKIPH